MIVGRQEVETHFRYLWMLRILDVRAALAARGYPPVDAEVTLAVDDPRYPDNAGPWRLVVHRGEATVEPAEAAGRPVPIGALSAMYTGFLRPDEAVTLGSLDAGDPTVDWLRTLLAGPDPWTPQWF